MTHPEPKVDPAQVTPTEPATPPEPPKPADPPPKKDETDWKAEARKWEQRAKDNTAAAKRLQEIEDAQKSEAQKAAERIEAAEKAAEQSRTEALRYRIATKHSISEEDAELFLTGADEETMQRQAERLAERIAAAGPKPPVQPNRQQGTEQPPATGSLQSGRDRYLARQGNNSKT